MAISSAKAESIQDLYREVRRQREATTRTVIENKPFSETQVQNLKAEVEAIKEKYLSLHQAAFQQLEYEIAPLAEKDKQRIRAVFFGSARIDAFFINPRISQLDQFNILLAKIQENTGTPEDLEKIEAYLITIARRSSLVWSILQNLVARRAVLPIGYFPIPYKECGMDNERSFKMAFSLPRTDPSWHTRQSVSSVLKKAALPLTREMIEALTNHPKGALNMKCETMAIWNFARSPEVRYDAENHTLTMKQGWNSDQGYFGPQAHQLAEALRGLVTK